METSARLDLTPLLDTLTTLAEPADLARIEKLQTRTVARRLRVLVAGEAKRGKSTLVNRLLDAEVLPTGVIPVTAIATTIRRDLRLDRTRVVVHFTDGAVEERDIEALADLITEQGNPRNEKGIVGVDIVLGAGPLDAYDVELVDTPGTGSVFTHNTSTARDAYRDLDAAIVVLTADPPISAAERDLLREVADRSVHTMVFLNKTDQLQAGELQEATQFTRGVCDEVTGDPTTLFAGSARLGRDDPGYRKFAEAFVDYLGSAAGRDLERALAGHVRHLVVDLLDATRLAQRSLELLVTGSQDRVDAFAGRLRGLRLAQAEIDDRGWAVERGLRRDLDVAAAHLRGRLVTECREALTQALDGSLTGVSTDDLEERGRVVITEAITSQVDPWREQQGAVLELGLQGFWSRVASEHETALASLRDAARELLDLDLVADTPSRRLTDGRGFWYLFDRPPSVELPFATLARRLTPGRPGRVRRRLADELPTLVDRQVGRARADLQARTQESMRALLADLRRTQDDLLERLAGALTEAEKTLQASTEAQSARRQELSERAARLVELLGRLESASR